MSVTNEENKVSYVANSNITYTIPFFFEENSHIEFYVDGEKQTYDEDYAVDGAGNVSGGQVTLLGPVYTAPTVLTIIRNVPLKQTNSLNEGGPFLAKTLERMFDRLTFMAQQIDEKLSRAVKFPIQTTGVDAQVTGEVLPNAILKFNGDGTGIEAGPDVSSFEDLLSGIVAAASDEINENATVILTEVVAEKELAITAKNQAQTQATNAANSATSSANSATAAQASATNAASSATTAGTKASEASTSATNANNSAVAAAQSAANAAAVSGLTTKGDLLSHNGTANVRLPVGADGSFLVSDAASSAGVKWAPYATPDSSITLAKLAAEVMAMLVPRGTPIPNIRSVVPPGFVSCMNKSIGLSGADYNGTVYQNLYNDLWAMAGLSTTAGDPFRISAAKGASASADWTAGKLITIDFVTNEVFVRALGSGKTLGAYYPDQFKAHTHDLQGGTGGGANSTNKQPTVTGVPVVDSNYDRWYGAKAQSGGSAMTGTETNPKYTPLNWIMKY